MQFVADLVRALAWPAATVTIVLVLRKPIGAALERGIRRLKAGPVEIEFDEELAEVREELERSPELERARVGPPPGPSLGEELVRLAEASPRASVMEGFARIEAQLRELVGDVEADTARRQGGVALARLAHRHGLISDETLNAVEGLAVLRNLAAHGRADEISTQRAIEYLALVDAVLFALRSGPPKATQT
jgi:hypothetical protein